MYLMLHLAAPALHEICIAASRTLLRHRNLVASKAATAFSSRHNFNRDGGLAGSCYAAAAMLHFMQMRIGCGV